MRIRIVAGKSLLQKAIIAQEKTAIPFTPSHVEAVSEDETGYIGAHLGGGMQLRPIGYDKDDIEHELILDLAAWVMPNQDRVFYDFINSLIGEPYDWPAIAGFIIPEHFHLENHVICSAAVSLALRKCGFFKYPLAAPAHLISPRDLLLMFSTRINIPGI